MVIWLMPVAGEKVVCHIFRSFQTMAALRTWHHA